MATLRELFNLGYGYHGMLPLDSLRVSKEDPPTLVLKQFVGSNSVEDVAYIVAHDFTAYLLDMLSEDIKWPPVLTTNSEIPTWIISGETEAGEMLVGGIVRAKPASQRIEIVTPLESVPLYTGSLHRISREYTRFIPGVGVPPTLLDSYAKGFQEISRLYRLGYNPGNLK